MASPRIPSTATRCRPSATAYGWSPTRRARLRSATRSRTWRRSTAGFTSRLLTAPRAGFTPTTNDADPAAEHLWQRCYRRRAPGLFRRGRQPLLPGGQLRVAHQALFLRRDPPGASSRTPRPPRARMRRRSSPRWAVFSTMRAEQRRRGQALQLRRGRDGRPGDQHDRQRGLERRGLGADPV